MGPLSAFRPQSLVLVPNSIYSALDLVFILGLSGQWQQHLTQLDSWNDHMRNFPSANEVDVQLCQVPSFEFWHEQPSGSLYHSKRIFILAEVVSLENENALERIRQII
jgi:hypothetical protein